MKILHFNGYFNENLNYQENFLIIGHQKLNIQTYLLTSRFEPDFKVNTSSRKKKYGTYNYKGVSITRLDHYMEVKKNALVLMKGVLKQIKKINPDQIFIHDVTPHIVQVLYYKIFMNKNVKLCIDFHSDIHNALNSKIGPFYHYFFRLIFKYFDKYFDKYYGVSPEAIYFMKKIYKIPENKIEHLPLPGDTSLIYQKEDIRSKIRKKLNISDEKIVVVHTGKMPQLKRTKLVLDTFKVLDNKKYELLLIGSLENNFDDILKSYTDNNKNIRYLGWIHPNEMNEIFIASDIMLQPGSLSHIFIEGICCGLPLILNYTDQGKSLTRNNNGLLFKGNNEKDLENLIHKLSDHIETYKLNALHFSKEYDYMSISSKCIL